jgi:tRNA1Val (adenine37-N6)-methyltransferase
MNDVHETLLEGERLDDLQCDGLKAIQHRSRFCFGLEAVLLVNFARIKPGETAADLGTGCGVIPLLLACKTRAAAIYGVEIEAYAADLAGRNARMNGLEDRVRIIHSDLREAHMHLGMGKMDVLTCNPPFHRSGACDPGIPPKHGAARRDTMAAMEEILQASFGLLRNRGRLYLVQQSFRCAEVLCLMAQQRIEPKKLQPVQTAPGKGASLVLVEGIKGAKPGLEWLPVLNIHEQDKTPGILPQQTDGGER